VELVLEAYEGYWRKVPHVKRLIMKGVPEGTTRLAMLKKGEADLGVVLEGPVAEEAKRDPRLQLVDARPLASFGSSSPISGTQVGLGGQALAPRGELCTGSVDHQ